MSGTALPTAGRFRFVASDRTGRPWITLFELRGVRQTGSGSGFHWPDSARARLLEARPNESAFLGDCHELLT